MRRADCRRIPKPTIDCPERNKGITARARYAAGTCEIPESWFAGTPIRSECLIVDGGKLAGTGAKSYSAGDATRGLENMSRGRKAA